MPGIADVLLVTVNVHETQALLEAFQQATGKPAVTVECQGRHYRNLGTLCNTKYFHALSEMGSGGVGGMQQSVNRAISALNPSAVIAVGIAFGINSTTQKIGDVLVSNQLRLYEIQRVGKDITLRGDKPHASPRLISFFTDFAQTSSNGTTVKSGVVLSGEKLLDNELYKSKLIEFEPEAVGGEMEGAGLYAACHEHHVDWIVVKAICDWADGNKAENKEHFQKLAFKECC